MAKATVLLIVESPGQFVELLRFASLLRSSRATTLLFLVYDCQPATQQILGRIKDLGAECLNIAQSSGGESSRTRLESVPQSLRAVLRSVRDALRPAILASAYRRLLQSRKVDLVVVPEDNVGSRSRALVAAATRLAIPVLLLPYTFANLDEAAQALRRRASHRVRRPDQRLFATMRPAWVRKAYGQELLRLPLCHALVLELAGLAPREPWIPNKGPVTVAVESPIMMQHYRRLGLSDGQLVLTGSLPDLVLEAALRDREQRRRALRERFALSDRPLLLCALPPDQLTAGFAAGEFADYAALVEAWTAALQAVANEFAILVRPHPRIDEAALAPLRRAGIPVTWDDTASLIPLCDLYVASVSATIRWAIACGRPVINYDVYDYDFADYAGVAPVRRVSTAAGFAALLRDLANSPERLAALAAAQARAAPEWGLLDGRSGERIVALADRLIDMRHRERMC
jgi:hypothetical protein